MSEVLSSDMVPATRGAVLCRQYLSISVNGQAMTNYTLRQEH